MKRISITFGLCLIVAIMASAVTASVTMATGLWTVKGEQILPEVKDEIKAETKTGAKEWAMEGSFGGVKGTVKCPSLKLIDKPAIFDLLEGEGGGEGEGQIEFGKCKLESTFSCKVEEKKETKEIIKMPPKEDGKSVLVQKELNNTPLYDAILPEKANGAGGKKILAEFELTGSLCPGKVQIETKSAGTKEGEGGMLMAVSPEEEQTTHTFTFSKTNPTNVFNAKGEEVKVNEAVYKEAEANVSGEATVELVSKEEFQPVRVYMYEGFAGGKKIAASEVTSTTTQSFVLKNGGTLAVVSCKKGTYKWVEQGPSENFIVTPTFTECEFKGAAATVNNEGSNCQLRFKRPNPARGGFALGDIIKAGVPACEIKIEQGACKATIKNIGRGSDLNRGTEGLWAVGLKNEGNNLKMEVELGKEAVGGIPYTSVNCPEFEASGFLYYSGNITPTGVNIK
ncbi:MAG: hypothetical protein WBQ21_07455 [Solirubrobacteraceae bacterium]